MFATFVIMLLDRVVATNGIQAPNPTLTTGIFGYVAQIGECYFPLFGKAVLPLGFNFHQFRSFLKH